jgi:uncharacterized protein (DUF58 family)
MTWWKKFCRRRSSPGKAVVRSSLLLTLLLGVLVATLTAAWWGWGWLFFAMGNGVILGLAAIDAWQLRRLPEFTATRVIDSLFEIGRDNPVIIRVDVSRPIHLKMWLKDDFPHGFTVTRRQFEITWQGETSRTLEYGARPHRRGLHVFQDLHLRVESPWRLLIFQQIIPARAEVKVFPRLEAVRRVRKGKYKRQSLPDNQPVSRAYGAGREFSHVREYLPDDDPRFINWTGTARLGKLVSNVYQPEIGQHVAILLDCGRLMGVQNEGLSQLDHALEAALGFAAVALQRGDRVSFLAFSDRVLRWVPSGKGMAHLQTIIEASFDLEAEYAESDYLAAWEPLSSHLRHRSLVALFTDAANLAFSETMGQMISRAKKRHVVMTVSMQDPRFKQLAEQLPATEEEVYRTLVLEQLMKERRESLQQWGKKVVALDVPPDKLAAAVITSYLEMRNRAER